MLSVFALILTILKLLIFIDVVMSWVMPDSGSRFPRNVTTQITDPLYAPIRALLKPEMLGGLDLSPMIVLMLIYAMERMLHSAM